MHLAERILASRHAISGERKQVTVLFCDILNSTALAERLGPEAMHVLLDAFFRRSLAEVHRYEGTLNQFLGDGFMALFGAPIAHEDHAQRAVLAAWEIKESLRNRPLEVGAGHVQNVSVRMGLNSGFVVVGKIGDNLRMDYTAIGDTTNLASRLEALAEPGAIYLTEATYRAAAQTIRCESLGTRAIKGVEDPVAVYKLEAVAVRREPRGVSEVPAIGSALVGRDREVGELRRSVERLQAGKGGVVLLRGDAGVGKSRLVAEMKSGFGEDGLWLEGRALSYARTISYWPFLEIIRTSCGITAEDSEAQSWVKLTARTQELFSSRLVDVLPYLGTLLGLRVEGEFEERIKYLDGRSMGAQILLVSRRFIEALAMEQPLVLVFEDLHWIDRSSAELLEHLLPLVEQVPLLIVGTSRPDNEGVVERLRMRAGELDDERAIHIDLSPLPANESRRLLEGLLGTSLSTGDRTLILRRAEGNAFFLEEIVRSLIATGALERDDSGRWLATVELEEITIPDTVQGVIMARIDRLDDDAKEVLKVGSVIGQSFLSRVIGAIADDVADLDRHLGELQERELIRKRRQIPELEYIFKHVLVQEATYGSILVLRRRELHRRVGECIEELFADRLEEFVGLLAHHFAQAEEWEKAQTYLLRAGDEAGRVAADVEALAHYEKAAATYGRAFGDRWDPVQRAQLERKMGEALFRRGQHQQAIEHLRGALALLGSPYPRSRRGVRLGVAKAIIRQLGHRLVPRSNFEPAAADVDDVTEQRYLAHEAMAWIDYFLDQERLLLDVLLGLNLCERSGLAAGVARGSAAVGIALDLSRLPRIAGRYHRRAVDLAERLGDPVAIGLAYLAKGVHGYIRGDPEVSIADCSHAADAYKEAGDLRGWGAATAAVSWAMRFKGDLSESLKTSQEILRVGIDSGDIELRSWGLGQEARTLRLMGDLEAGLRRSEESLELFDSIPDYVDSAAVLSDIGMYHLAKGRPEQALAIMEEAQRLIADRGLRGLPLTQNRIALAECLLRIAELSAGSERSHGLKRAKRACRAALRYSEAVRDGIPGANRVNGTRQWLEGNHAAARRWWQRSLVAAERSGAQYDLGLTQLEMGLRMNGQAHLERAAAIFGEIGATFELSRADAALGTSNPGIAPTAIPP